MTTTMTPVEQLSQLLMEANKIAADADVVDGKTSHPSENVDDGTSKASEGSRASEHTQDVKKEIGKASTDSQANPSPQKGADTQLNIGVQQSMTGEDAAIETASVRAELKDPGVGGLSESTEHPMQLNNPEVTGKYATASATLDAIKLATASGNAVLAEIAVSSDGTGKQASTETSVAPAADKEAGADLAAVAANDARQQAEYAAYVTESLGETIKFAEDRAMVVITHLKQAEAPQDPQLAAALEQGDNIQAPEAAAAMGAVPMGAPAEMGAAPMGAPAEMPPVEAPPTELPPEAGGGMLPEGGQGGDTKDEILAVLSQLSPEQLGTLIEALGEMAAAEGGEAPAEAPVGAPSEAPPAEDMPVEEAPPLGDEEKQAAAPAKQVQSVVNFVKTIVAPAK